MTMSFCQFLGCLVPALPRTKWSRFTSATPLTATASRSSILTLTESPESSRGQSSITVLWSMASYVKVLFNTCCPSEAFFWAQWVQFQLRGGLFFFYSLIDVPLGKQIPSWVAALVMFLFSRLLPKLRTYFCVQLIDGLARIFHNSFTATGNRTLVSSVAPLLRDLNLGRFIDWATTAAALMMFL